MKKLLIFLMLAIPILAIVIVKLTSTVAVGDIYISIERIVLSENEITATVGDSVDLSYVIYPNAATDKEVRFSSSNEEAAVVDEKGHVDFVGIGSGYISAMNKDGSRRSYCSFYVGDTKVHQVKLNFETSRLHLGGSLQLTAEIVPNEALNREVIFSSDNEQVAVVDPNGLVHGLSIGNVNITAVSVDGGFSDTASLSVIRPVTSLNVEKEEIITSNKNEQVEYRVLPEDATIKQVNFELDNPSIADITDWGYLTFLQPGEVNVTLTTEDGNFKKVVKYIYTADYVFDIIITNPSITMNINDEPVIISYETMPANYTNVEIVSEDENIAYVSSGCLYAVKGGSTTISLKAYKNEAEQITKTIYVNVVSPATDIEIEDVITAEKTFTLTPTSLPKYSTNLAYFYHLIDGAEFASVSLETGEVNFSSQTPCTVTVRIFANEDNSTVSKDVKITYTAGKPYAFELVDKELTLSYGETVILNYNILPTTAASIKPTISAEENNNVIELLPDGRIRAVGGGKAKIKLSFTLYDNSIVEEYCNITVIRYAEQIEINVNLDYYNNQYVTSKNTVQFSGNVLPADATYKNIVWSVSDNSIAFINEGNLIFNQVGSVLLIADVNNTINSIEIYYAGTNPVYAEVQAEMNGERKPIPSNIMLNESFNVEISKLIPNYEKLPELSLEVINTKTSSSLGKVLVVDGSTVTAVAGGTAELIVHISNSIRLNYVITVIRMPKSITVLQANSKITTSSITLTAEVMPADTTNKNVKFIVHNPDVADCEGATLTFKTNGIAHITAVSLANENVTLDFIIEKIEKDVVHASVEQGLIDINKGELLTFSDAVNFSISILSESPIVEGEKVVCIENERYLRALSGGEAKVKISTQNGDYEITISVKQLVENVTLSSDIDFYNDEYVSASNVITLNFNVLPTNASNKGVTASIVKQDSNTGGERIAEISKNRITFIKAGVVTLEIKSDDGNFVSMVRLRYTGGTAVDAQLNVGSRIVMNIGEKVTLGVAKWVPKDVVSSRFLFKEIVSASGKKIIEVNDKTRTITALESGEAVLIIELSSGIIKEIEIVCVNEVKDIVVEENVLTSNNSYTISAQVVPSNATNKTLEFELEKTDLAKIENNTVTFLKAGTVIVYVHSTDASNIEKKVTITSSMGYINNIKLNLNEVTIITGETHKIFADYFPSDAVNNEIKFKILSYTSFYNNSLVVELTQDGQVKALCAGSAVVRAYAIDYYGQEVYADCTITVRSPLSSIDVQFEYELENYQNKTTFITSRSVIPFKIVCTPVDAQILNYSYEISNDNFAKIEDGKIIFLQKGRVSITFTCTDYSTQKSITYSFNFVGSDLIEAELNKQGFENNVITIKAGESVQFKLKKAVPNDNKNLEFSITDTTENRNDPNKQVAKFENGTLYALNGGSYSFTLWVNGYKLENLTLVVIKDAVGIEVVGGDNIYISIPSYSIEAHVIETDASQTKLGFRLINSKIAEINQNGSITFNSYGSCQVEIYVVENPSITRTITITYTKELQAIIFAQTRDSMYVGEYIDLSILAVPQDADNFEFDVTLDNYNIASITNKNGSYRLISTASGTVTITAKVVGKDITAVKTITIYDKIADIKLDLDKEKDANGQGNYRVFGNQFLNDAGEFTNSYTMGVSLIPSNLSKDLLEWSSSNEQIATVNEFGVVTFLKAGKVIITVKQKVPYPGALSAVDSYEFNIVEGVNVNNYNQFVTAHKWLTTTNKDKNENFASLVLHNDILIEGSFGVVTFNYNVFGNGYMLDLSRFVSNWENFVIARSNITLDNLTLRAVSVSSGNELSDAGVALIIQNCSNILIYNCKIENAETGIRIESAQVDVVGCIIQNCLSVGIKLARANNVASTVKVRDSVFYSSFCGILFVADRENQTNRNTLILEGDVWFYNWSTAEQLEHGLDLNKLLQTAGLSFAAEEIISQVKKILINNGSNFAYDYNGETYYNFAVVSIYADITIAGITFDSAGTLIKTGLSPTCTYSTFEFSGALDMKITAVPVSCSVLSIQAKGAFIKPGEKYVDNPNLWKIKQPCRF